MNTEEKAQELYPNNKTFCGGVAQIARDAFINGARMQRDEMMKGVVEAEILLTPYPTICLDDCKDYDFKDGQKVHVIFVKEENK